MSHNDVSDLGLMQDGQKKLIDLQDYERDHFNSIIEQDVSKIRPDLIPGYQRLNQTNDADLHAPKPPKLNGVLLHENVDDATQVFNTFTYFRGSGTTILNFLLLIGTRAFFIAFPFIIGQYVCDAQSYYSGSLSQKDFDTSRHTLFLSLGITALITAFCEQGQVSINCQTAEKMSMNILYAIPFSYNKKCIKIAAG